MFNTGTFFFCHVLVLSDVFFPIECFLRCACASEKFISKVTKNILLVHRLREFVSSFLVAKIQR